MRANEFEQEETEGMEKGTLLRFCSANLCGLRASAFLAAALLVRPHPCRSVFPISPIKVRSAAWRRL